MSALPADIAAASREALIERYENAELRDAFPGARDGSLSPAEGFCDLAADAQTVVNERGAILAGGPRFTVDIADLVWLDPTRATPNVQLVDDEQAFDGRLCCSRIELDLEEETTGLELFTAPPIEADAPVTNPALRIAPAASGSADGSSWDNAAPLSALNTMIIRAAAIGSEVWLRADAGSYARDSALTISAGGLAGQPVVIRGVDVDGNDMKAEIVGSRYVDTTGTYNWGLRTPAAGAQPYGNEVLRLNAGADHLCFRNLRFRNQGSGCFRIRQDIADLTIEDCDAYNVARFVEGGAASGAPTASVSGFTMRRCEGHGYSKGFMRLRYASTNILVEDCVADSERQDGDNFAAGFTLHDTAGPATFRRCVAKNHIDSYHVYQQGDGFSSEIRNGPITYEDCESYNNTDGGWDCKSDNLVLLRCKSVENHRNYRIWGLAELIDCISQTPKDNAGTNKYSKAHVIGMSGSLARIYGGTFTEATSTTRIFDTTEGAIIAVSPTTAVTGGVYKREEAASGNSPAAIVTTLDPNDHSTPVIDPSVTAIAVDENKTTRRAVLAADGRVITIRTVSGGGVISRAGYNLVTSRQDYEDAGRPNPRVGSIIAYDTNGNASAVTPIYVTVNDVADDPISPAILAADGCTDFGWWDLSAPGGAWQDSAGTIPAVDDNDPVRRISDLSGHGHHWIIADEAAPLTLNVQEGLVWIEPDGVGYYTLADTAELRFTDVTSIHAIRRDPLDTATRYVISHAGASNDNAWMQSVVGGSSFRISRGSASDSSTAGGATVGKDVVLGYQTRPYEGRSNDTLLINPSTTDSKTPSYLTAFKARLFADGNGSARLIGRYYGGVATNRTETDPVRFRLARRMGQLAGLEL